MTKTHHARSTKISEERHSFRKNSARYNPLMVAVDRLYRRFSVYGVRRPIGHRPFCYPPVGVRAFKRWVRRGESDGQQRLSPVQQVRGGYALKVSPMSTNTQSDKTVSVAQEDNYTEWARQTTPDYEPVVELEEDRVGSMNHLLG